jgi:hypothetical protein
MYAILQASDNKAPLTSSSNDIRRWQECFEVICRSDRLLRSGFAPSDAATILSGIFTRFRVWLTRNSPNRLFQGRNSGRAPLA